MTEPTGETPRPRRRTSTRAAKAPAAPRQKSRATRGPAARTEARDAAANAGPSGGSPSLPPIVPAPDDAGSTVDGTTAPEDDPWAAILGPTDASEPDVQAPPVPEAEPEPEPGVAAPDREEAAGAPSGPVAPVAGMPVDSAPPRARLASPDDLKDWDEHTVASPNGHVYQSLAWGQYRAAHGRPVWHVVFDDGFRVLVVGRDRPVVGGGWAYATRGPVPEVDPALTANRAAAIADLLANEGLDSFTIDGETPAASGLGALLAERGFRPVEEVQTSRHRMDVSLGPEDAFNSDEETIFASFGATTRNNIRQAERQGLRVKRLDAGGGRPEHDSDAPRAVDGLDHIGLEDPGRVEHMLRTFYVMLGATAERRGFALASENAFLDWSERALAAGHMLYLQAEHGVDGPVAGAVFYRHGHRLTYSLAGDRAELRKSHPGAVRLLVWRGIQIALDERRTSVDLGGVDTEGARGRPDKGDATYGMYQFKESFGARWVDMTGAHQRTMRPMRNLAGRVLGRLGAIRR